MPCYRGYLTLDASDNSKIVEALRTIERIKNNDFNPLGGFTILIMIF